MRLKGNPMLIQFTKMHGLGNDFMVIDAVRQKVQPTTELIRQWADRHTGIGFDQLLLVESPHDSQTDFFYRIFNADGHEVEQCGNGARCLALFLHAEKLTDKNPIIVGTLAGNLELKLEKDQQVTVSMGVPNFEPAKIPMLADQLANTYKISLGKEIVEFYAVSLGNPHCIILVDNIEEAPVEKLGSILTSHPNFPESVNVGFMQILSPSHIRLRVYERGAGETLSCGSGACAAAVIGNKSKLLQNEVRIDQKGGALLVTWPDHAAPVRLTGPATFVYRGSITL